MALEKSKTKASLRVRNNVNTKTLQTFSGIKPDAAPADILEFTQAGEMLRSQFYGFIYLNVTSEVADV